MVENQNSNHHTEFTHHHIPAYIHSLVSQNSSVFHSVSLTMAFHHRKLLYHKISAPTPSPLQSPPFSLPKPLFPLPLTSPSFHHFKLKALPLAMVIIASMCCMLTFLCCVSIIIRRYHSSRRRYINNQRSRTTTPILFDVSGDSSPVFDDGVESPPPPFVDHPIWLIRTVGLQQSVIDSITVFKYRKDEGIVDGAECSVCLGEFEQDENLRLLPKCSHAFHIPCIDTWLRSHKNCPLCRAPVINDAADGNGSGGGVNSDVSGETHENQVTQIENFDAEVGSEESEIIGDDDSESFTSGTNFNKVLPSSLAEEMEDEIQPLRRFVSMDSSSSSASTIFHDVIDSISDRESSDTEFVEKIELNCKEVSIGKQGSGSSNTFNLASIGRALQKRPVSMRRSFSHNRKSLFSRHSRSQSLTLPL